MKSSLSDNPHPYYQANLWSRLFHGWISSLLKKSHKQRTIHLTDLCDLLLPADPAAATQTTARSTGTRKHAEGPQGRR